jgi:translation initiation factor 3 subunit L
LTTSSLFLVVIFLTTDTMAQYYADATADPESLLPATMDATAPGISTGNYEQYIDEHGGVPEGNNDYVKELEEERRTQLEQVPDDVKRFIVAFHQAIVANDSAQISSMYESGWNRLTAQYYADSEWPEAELLSGLVGGDQVFLTLYRELYFRHVYAKLEPNVDDRFQSYENICELFNLLLNSDEPIALDLPIQWLWDMLDEFVYQFQSFTAWRAEISKKTEDEKALLAENPQIWSCYSVLNVLYSLVQRSRINEQLAAERAGESAEKVAEIAGAYGAKPLYRNLGYFSLICLLRVHVLIGDPTLALQTLVNVELSSEALFTKITACHISTYYHVGFAYMTLGRFHDAIRSFVSALIYFNRMKSFHTRSYQYGSVSRGIPMLDCADSS